MNHGDPADQVVRMTLQGIEVGANVALKVGGVVVKSIAATIYAMIKQSNKVKGAVRLDNMLKSDKELKVFALRHEDLKKFCQEAKGYGILYSVLKEKHNKDGICDVMVRAEDAAKISRVVDKFELATIDTKAMQEEILAGRDSLKDVPIMSDEEHDAVVNSLMDKTLEKDSPLSNENPQLARTQKTSDNRFEHISKTANVAEGTSERPSIRKELKQIKNEQAKRVDKNKESGKVRSSKFKSHTKVKKKKMVKEKS